MASTAASTAELSTALETDFEQLRQNLHEPEALAAWSGPHFSFPLRREAFARHLRLRFPGKPRRLCLVFRRQQDGRFSGYFEFGRIDYAQRNTTLARILIDHTLRRRGLGRMMVSAALQMGFETLRLHRIDLRVYEQNRPALRLYDSLGFRSEGLLRETLLVNGQWWSARSMSLLEQEWRGRARQ
ncbi:MAG: GNAT family N-acetyltransferase [Leptospirales bacterium]|nr:GNAT family N-acetyltransferase [Leptospirales bacterium]